MELSLKEKLLALYAPGDVIETYLVENAGFRVRPRVAKKPEGIVQRSEHHHPLAWITVDNKYSQVNEARSFLIVSVIQDGNNHTYTVICDDGALRDVRLYLETVPQANLPPFEPGQLFHIQKRSDVNMFTESIASVTLRNGTSAESAIPLSDELVLIVACIVGASECLVLSTFGIGWLGHGWLGLATRVT